MSQEMVFGNTYRRYPAYFIVYIYESIDAQYEAYKQSFLFKIFHF